MSPTNVRQEIEIEKDIEIDKEIDKEREGEIEKDKKSTPSFMENTKM